MTGLEGPATDAEKAAGELQSALALVGVEAPSISWSAAGGGSPLSLVHIIGIQPQAARTLARVVRRGIRGRDTQGVPLPQTAEDLRAALDPMWFRPCRCEERTGIPCPEKQQRQRLRGSTTPDP